MFKKMFAVSFLSLFIAVPVFGQGTVPFQVSLDGAHAAPPNSSTRRSLGGSFTLDSSRLFSGSVGLVDHDGITSVSLFRSTSIDLVGTRLYDFDPGLTVAPGINGQPGSQEFDFARMFTPAEAADLQSGFLWVNVITPGFPNGELRGQITAVPEPHVLALIALGIVTLLVHAKRRVLN
jgi:hypothetical protein